MKIRVVGIALVILGIFVGSVCTYFIGKVRDDVKGERIEIGKSFNFIVDQNNVINADEINRILAIEKNHLIQLLNATEVNKLVQFMSKNSFQIAPGEYVLNQTDRFEQLMLKLYFKASE